MEIQLTATTVSAMAKRLRANVGTQHMTVSASLEVLAKTLGYRTYDELIGLAKRNVKSEPAAPEFAPFDLYLSAYANSDFERGPRWAKVWVTPSLMATILTQKALAEEDKVEHIALDWVPTNWDNNSEYRVGCVSMYVSSREFWFTGYPKHASYEVETNPLCIESLLSCILKPKANDSSLAWVGDILMYSADSNVRGLAQMLQDDEVIDVDESILDGIPKEFRP